MQKRKHKDPLVPLAERGNIAPLALAAAVILFVVLAFSVDQAIACAAKVRQEHALNAAREACMDPAFSLVTKNSENPGLAIANKFSEKLRAEGFRGKVSVWFYEVPRGGLPASRRVWGVAVQVQEDVATLFARGYGIVTLPVASKCIAIAQPYADTVVWKPRESRNGLFDQVGSGAGGMKYTPIYTLEKYPSELVEATNAAAQKIRKQG